MNRTLVVLVACAPWLAAAQLANEPTISADAAMEAATAALKQCRADGEHVSVTVVDASGRAKVQLRDDGAAPHTAEHSMRKAYTALSYKMPSAEYGKRTAEAKGIAIGPQLLPNITTAAGGVPIRVGNAVIGAVGVSGTPGNNGGGEHDAKCAEAGIARATRVAGDAAQFRGLAFKYYKGEGVAQDSARALQYFEKAAHAGDLDSAMDLAKIYEYGMGGIAQDEMRAAQWYLYAAERGEAMGQFNASVMLYKGQGVARDKVEAAKWWTLAIEHGGAHAEMIRKSVESAEAKLTPEEVAEGRRRAAQWRVAHSQAR